MRHLARSLLLLGLSICPCLAPLAAAATADDPTARPGPVAWPAGPLEVRVALPEPIEESEAHAFAGRPIPYRAIVGEADSRPSDPIGRLGIAGVALDHGGRTLVLLTDPHPAEAAYRVEAPEGFEDLTYDLTGLEASWTAEGDDEPSWSGWLPELDLAASRQRLAPSVEHEQLWRRIEAPGALTLRTLLDLPDQDVLVTIAADRPFEAELAYVPLEVDGSHKAEQLVEPFGEPVELYLTIPTGPPSDDPLPSLTLTLRLPGDNDGEPRPISRSAQLLPWSPPPIEDDEEIPPLPEELAGGDPVRGEAVFFGEKGKCSDCHRLGDRGGVVGPDLTGIGARHTLAEIYREIEAPSAEIDPDYRPYSIALADGRVLVGLVRAEGPELIRVVGSDAQVVELGRAEIEEIRPVATSIMPVGLAGALGQADLRDLLAYLAGSREP